MAIFRDWIKWYRRSMPAVYGLCWACRRQTASSASSEQQRVPIRVLFENSMCTAKPKAKEKNRWKGAKENAMVLEGRQEESMVDRNWCYFFWVRHTRTRDENPPAHSTENEFEIGRRSFGAVCIPLSVRLPMVPLEKTSHFQIEDTKKVATQRAQVGGICRLQRRIAKGMRIFYPFSFF